MKCSLALILIISLLAVACGKTEDVPSESDASNSAVVPAAQNGSATPEATTPAAPRNIAEQPVAQTTPAQLAGLVHEFMTEQLQVFIKQKGRMPQNFAEFAGARMDSVPRPPPGFRWEIDQASVQVKLVRE